MDELHGYYLEDLSVGMSETLVKVVTEKDVVEFAHLSGDVNPVHINEDWAKTTMFKGRIAHGILTASFISAVLGTRLPGPGCVYLSQYLRFRAPVKLGDKVATTATIKQVDGDRRRISLDTVCRVGDTAVLEGEAMLLVNRRAEAVRQEGEEKKPAKAVASQGSIAAE